MEKGMTAAQHRFPERGRSIERLAMRDEDFRDLCIDLADAQAALRRWEMSTEPTREARCLEYEDMVGYLLGEIETALDKADVIPLATRKTTPQL